MSEDLRARSRFVPELVAAGVVLILGAVGSARLAFFPPTELPIGPATWSAVTLLMAALLAAAGVECIRTRHFPLVLLVAVAPALATLLYVAATGRTDDLSGFWMPMVVMAIVASQRSAFKQDSAAGDADEGCRDL
jgi:hypothetical protein